MRGSLRKNLCYGAGTVDDERVREVVAQCELGMLVERMPGGLDGRIAESGADLSQGERVRVGLARALLRRPRILLLDEPEANLDSQAIRVLEDVVSRFQGTVLMATHRRAALRMCNECWRLRDGCLESTGDGPPVTDCSGELVVLRGPVANGHPEIPAVRLQGGQ